MIADTELKKRFCKDMGVKISVFKEPYFSERLRLFDAEDDFNRFLKIIDSDFDGDSHKYFNFSDALTNKVIDDIKNTKEYEMLNSDDMKKYTVVSNASSDDVYKDFNVGRTFISIDLASANFNSLVYYSRMTGLNSFNDGEYNYTKYISKFTDIDLIINSKHIRQIIFGHCNSKRLATFQKYIMYQVFSRLKQSVPAIEAKLVSFRSDEIIFDVTNLDSKTVNAIHRKVSEISDSLVPLHYEMYKLINVANSDAFIKKIFTSDKGDNKIDIVKCNPIDIIFIYRALKNQEVTQNDRVFYSQYGLAKLMEVPNIEIGEL